MDARRPRNCFALISSASSSVVSGLTICVSGIEQGRSGEASSDGVASGASPPLFPGDTAPFRLRGLLDIGVLLLLAVERHVGVSGRPTLDGEIVLKRLR